MVHDFVTSTKIIIFYNAKKYKKLLFCYRRYFRRFSRRLCHGNVLIMKNIHICIYMYINVHVCKCTYML